MKGSHCRLFDENLVRNIMISTGVSIMEFVKENRSVDIEEICDFVEFNANDIITETINSLNSEEEGANLKTSADTIGEEDTDEMTW